MSLGFNAHPTCRHASQASLIDESDLFVWDLHLYDFASEDPISADLKERNLDCVTLRANFPPDYPNSPPFVYVLRPRLKENTGYVLRGGGICGAAYTIRLEPSDVHRCARTVDSCDADGR